jgi:hypothetical protein
MKRHPFYYWPENPLEDATEGHEMFRRAIEQGPGEIYFRLLQAQTEDENERKQRVETGIDEDVFDDLELERVSRNSKRDDDDDDDERLSKDDDEYDIEKMTVRNNAAMRSKVPEKPALFKVIGAKSG